MEKFHTIYKITNKINGKIYIGAHTTSNPNDSYLGSGDKILLAIKKYGKQNFSKEILSYHSTKKDMYKEEARIVTEDFIKQKNNYNVVVGGKQPPSFKGKKHSIESRSKISKANRGQPKTIEHKEKLRNRIRTANHSRNISFAKKGKPNGKGRPVVCVELGKIFKDAIEAKNYFGLKNHSSIHNAAKRNRTSAGYHWKYVEKKENYDS